MIQVFPSRLPGEALETHRHGRCTIDSWLRANVPSFTPEADHPIDVEIDGVVAAPEAWPTTWIDVDHDVRIYPIPRLEGAAAVVYWVVVAILAAYAIYMAATMPSGSRYGQGDSLSLDTARANTARLGSPIREVLGRCRVWADYLVQPVSRFVGEKTFLTHMFLCVGKGHHIIPYGSARLGNTPLTSFGDQVQMTIYPPGADVGADERSENWVNSTEVGATGSGTSGLDLSETADVTTSINADSVTVDGNVITLNNATVTDANGKEKPATAVPDGWIPGALLTVKVAADFSASTSGLYSVIAGDAIRELSPFVGMPVLLTYNAADYELFVVSYYAGSPLEPPSITLAYESAGGVAFGGLPPGPVSLSVARGSSEYRISSVSGLTLTLARMTEAGVPDPSWLGWLGRTTADYRVSGIEEGEDWLGPFLVCPDGETTDAFEYDLNFPGGLIWYTEKGNKRTFTVTLRVAWRRYGSGSAWTVQSHTYTAMSEDALGYTERILLDAPGQIEVRVRRVTERGGSSARDACYWQGLRARLSERPTRYEDLTTIALTVTTGTKLAAQSDRRFNVEATRQYQVGSARTISGAMTHVMRSLGLPDYEIDTETLDHLEQAYWTPRGEFFDFSAEKAGTSALDLLQMAAQAGMGYFLLHDSMCSAGREGVKAWRGGISPQRQLEQLTTTFSAPGPDDFDGVDVTYIDDVTWAAETVECRLPSGDTPWKVETFELQGVGNRDRAYRIGMRRLMKHQGQRLTYTTKTEMMGLVYQYGDRVKLFDDIPGSSTMSTMIESAFIEGNRLVIEVAECLDWSLAAPRCLIRFQDGSLSGVILPARIDEHRLSVALTALPSEHPFSTWIMDDPSIDPPELIFCDSTRMGYDAVLAELTPGDDGSVELTALQYDPAFYQYDDAAAP